MLDRALKAVVLVIAGIVAVWLVACTVEAVAIGRDPAGYLERELDRLFRATP